jgi:hypothetical protein
MHLNRRGEGLVSKQLASEIWKLFATEEIPPISLGWKVAQEQVVSSLALVHETMKVNNGYHTEELKIVPDKLAVEDKYVVDYPQNELIIVPDKQVTEDQHVKETGITSINSLNCGTVIEDNNTDILFKSKRIRKALITRTDYFYGKT